jgi:hypothetical protein
MKDQGIGRQDRIDEPSRIQPAVAEGGIRQVAFGIIRDNLRRS